MNAIPTKYAGVQFRSRLEARYAAWWDLREVKWAYEPIDLRGYVPDFLIRYEESQTQILIEIKPHSTEADLLPAAKKIEESGWKGPVRILGIDPSVMMVRGERWSLVQPFLGPEWERDWREAGNRVQWKSPVDDLERIERARREGKDQARELLEWLAFAGSGDREEFLLDMRRQIELRRTNDRLDKIRLELEKKL